MFHWLAAGLLQRFRCGPMPLFIWFPAGNFRSHFGIPPRWVTAALGAGGPQPGFLLLTFVKDLR